MAEPVEAEAPEVAEIEQTQTVVQAAPEETVEQPVQPESEAAATETAETEAQAEAPKTITLSEAQEMVKQAKSELESKWTEKLQGNAQNTKLAEALQSLSDHLAGKKPQDPNQLPPGFDALPSELQQYLLQREQDSRRQAEMLGIIQEQQIRRSVDEVVYDFHEDEQYGKLFKEVEPQIASDIKQNPRIHQWVRENPQEAIEFLFKKHAFGRVTQVTAQQKQDKVQAAVRAATRPSSVSTSVETVPAKGKGGMSSDAAFEKAWAEKVGADKTHLVE